VSDAAHTAIESAARTSYGRLVALLAARSRDVAGAEDALSDAFLSALRTWPSDGVPANPDAWLLAAARRRMIDAGRREDVRRDATPALTHMTALASAAGEGQTLPDRRLELLFACAHPAIDPAIRTPLMLQTVLGLEATDIAGAFLTAPAAMAQRLVRAKRKIRDAGIPFEIPDAAHLGPRLDDVLHAIYAAFGAGWDALSGGDPTRVDLTDEAIFLGRLIVAAIPDHAESRGLLALMLYCHARRAARRTADGAYVPLSQQLPQAWDQAMIGEAEALLTALARLGAPGRYQVEAAIQSAHIGRVIDPSRDPAALVYLYDALLHYAPTVGALVNRAAAIAVAHGAQAGLDAASAIPASLIETYQPFWALSAHLLEALGRTTDADQARARAAGMTSDPAVRAFLLGGAPER
jgi:predicted RNA polymerase sigma factor